MLDDTTAEFQRQLRDVNGRVARRPVQATAAAQRLSTNRAARLSSNINLSTAKSAPANAHGTSLRRAAAIPSRAAAMVAQKVPLGSLRPAKIATAPPAPVPIADIARAPSLAAPSPSLDSKPSTHLDRIDVAKRAIAAAVARPPAAPLAAATASEPGPAAVRTPLATSSGSLRATAVTNTDTTSHEFSHARARLRVKLEAPAVLRRTRAALVALLQRLYPRARASSEGAGSWAAAGAARRRFLDTMARSGLLASAGSAHSAVQIEEAHGEAERLTVGAWHARLQSDARTVPRDESERIARALASARACQRSLAELPNPACGLNSLTVPSDALQAHMVRISELGAARVVPAMRHASTYSLASSNTSGAAAASLLALEKSRMQALRDSVLQQAHARVRAPLLAAAQKLQGGNGQSAQREHALLWTLRLADTILVRGGRDLTSFAKQ